MPIPRPSADAAAAQRRYARKEDLDRTNQRLRQYPAPAMIWSSDRPDLGFGVGDEPIWSHTGDGSSTAFATPGRLSMNAARYVVIVGGITQPPFCFSLSSASEVLTFFEPPPAGAPIAIFAPFYGVSAT